jgi:hypothetical protein
MATSPELRGIREELLALYQQWQTLTAAEGEAIRAWDWANVEHFQALKQELQQTIATAAAQLRDECIRHGVDTAAITEEFQDIIGNLLQQEAANRDTLVEQRRQTQAELQVLDVSCRNLLQLRKTYAPNSDDGWQSYS